MGDVNFSGKKPVTPLWEGLNPRAAASKGIFIGALVPAMLHKCPPLVLWLNTEWKFCAKTEDSLKIKCKKHVQDAEERQERYSRPSELTHLVLIRMQSSKTLTELGTCWLSL